MKVIGKWWGIVVCLLTGLQIAVSPPLDLLDQTVIEKAEMWQRMNDYPPRLARVAHILEERPESRLIQKLASNFFEIFDVEGLGAILMWLSIIGVFRLIKDKQYRLVLVGLIPPLTILTIFGVNRIWGNFCLYPLIGLSLTYGLVKKT